MPTIAAERVDDFFDEGFYLETNPDVADAVAHGGFADGRSHWMDYGRMEGRLPNPHYDEGETVNEAWYLSAYPMVRIDIANGRAQDPEHHFRTLGQYRGYRPNTYAPRPDNPAGFASRFGGCWLDQANASDLIEGKQQLGRLTAAQAKLLRDWARDGYVILRNALPRRLVDRAAAQLHAAYDGKLPAVRFECPKVGGYAPIGWSQAVRENPAKALDLHWWSEAIRNVIFADPIRTVLELIFERRILASQSLTFLHGSTQSYHQDTLYVPFSLPTQFAASWVALEDVTPGGGELMYYPGSHKTPEYLYGGVFKTLWDAQHRLKRKDLRDEMASYSADLEARCKNGGLQPATFLARKGDVLIWHADLAHGGLPITVPSTRASVVTHYCPSELASLTFETGNTQVRPHRKLAWYASRYYT